MTPKTAAAMTTNKVVSVLVNVLLKLKSKVSLFPFDDQMGSDLLEKGYGQAASDCPVVGRSVGVQLQGHAHGTTKGLLEQVRDSRINHSEDAGELVSDVATRLSSDPSDADATLPVEDPCGVLDVHSDSCEALDGMSANSVETQNGQYRAKQERKAPGVCNEYGLTAKAKMYSELRRNTEKAAEMTVSHRNELYPVLVTDCNTDFLKAYVDPNRFFKATDWMPTLNQDGKVLRIHTRMNYVCTNRMLQGVISGWS